MKFPRAQPSPGCAASPALGCSRMAMQGLQPPRPGLPLSCRSQQGMAQLQSRLPGCPAAFPPPALPSPGGLQHTEDPHIAAPTLTYADLVVRLRVTDAVEFELVEGVGEFALG